MRGARQKETGMHAHGQTPAWGTHMGGGRASSGAGWYQRLSEWWAARHAARREAKLAALSTRWDAQQEVIRPRRADAAPEMATAPHTLSVDTILYGLRP
jgi:hypothetical protein